LGQGASFANSVGNCNIAVGRRALYCNTSGSVNIAIGDYSLVFNTNSNSNIAIGTKAMYASTTGCFNIALGIGSLGFNQTGNSNIAIGTSALCSNTSGRTNIAIGYSANSQFAGSNNIVIGTNIGLPTSVNNQINIGGLIFGSGSNALSGSAAGFQSITGSANGSVGINQPNPRYTLDVSGSFGLNQAAFINQNTASLASGTRTLFTNATGSFNSAFYNYVLLSGSNARAGQVMSVWNGGSIRFTDVTTTDIGSTTAVVLTASLSGANVVLSSTLPTSGWTFETVVNLI